MTSLLSSAPVYFKIKKSAQLNPRGDFIFKDSSRRSTTRSQANLTSSCPELMSSLALSLDAIHPSLSLFKSTPPPVVITSKGVKRRIYKHSGASVEITPKPKNNTHPDQQEHCDSHEPGHFVEAEPFDVPFAVLVAVEQGTKMKIEGKMVSIREREMLVFRGDIMHQGVEYEVANRRIHAYFDSMDPMYSRPTNGRGEDLTFFGDPTTGYRYTCSCCGSNFQTFSRLSSHWKKEHEGVLAI